MPKSADAKKVLKKFKDQYGFEQGEKVYYATANKQGRDPDTFKKESVILSQDVIIEHDGEQFYLSSGTILEMAVSTGEIAIRDAAIGQDIDHEEDEDDED